MDQVADDSKTERNFGLMDLIYVLEQSSNMLTEASSASPQDQWLVIFEIHQLLYTVVVVNTCLDLHGFNKLARYYDVTAMPPEEWLKLLKGYCDTYLKACREEFEKYGNSEG